MLRKMVASVKSNAKSDGGNVAMTFGLMSFAMFVLMGGAIDFGRWHHARSQTQSALDAAVLAAGRQLLVDNQDINKALSVANAYYNENIKSRLPLLTDSVTFEAANNNMAIRAAGNATIETTFLKLANIDSLKVVDLTASNTPTAEIATGSNVGVNLEIALMLDVTGSMAGTKLSDLKVAAKNLVDVIVWEDQSNYTSRIAVVPFSHAINAGSTYFNKLTGAQTNSTLAAVEPAALIGPDAPSLASRMLAAVQSMPDLSFVSAAHAKKGKSKGNNWGNSNNGNGNGKGNGNGNGNGNNGNDDDDDDGDGGNGNSNSVKYSPCVVDRTGPEALTDTAPAAGKYFDVFDIKKASVSHVKDEDCKPGNVTIMPLNSNKEAIKAKIDSFSAGGYTAGHIGTMFAWYMLSPKWSHIWPASSEPAAYDDAGTKKIAILMTDGEYNTYYNGNSNGDASAQAVALCTGMKAQGIEVFTVGFKLGGNSTAINTLNSCATSAGHAYNAEQGSELQQAFFDIAIKISNLRLTQ